MFAPDSFKVLIMENREITIDVFEEMKLLLEYNKIKFFPAHEVLFLGEANNDKSHPAYQKNSYPPVSFWPNIITVLKIADIMRARFGRCRLISIYRNPTYNKLTGGASKSEHMEFMAIDMQFEFGDPIKWAKFAQELRSTKIFSGGIGIYDTFIHIDNRGYTSNWNYSTKYV